MRGRRRSGTRAACHTTSRAALPSAPRWRTQPEPDARARVGSRLWPRSGAAQRRRACALRATSYSITARTTRRPIATICPPALEEFNWALDWFDAIAADERRPAGAVDRRAGRRRDAAHVRRAVARSNQVANWLREQGVDRGDRVLADARQPGRAVGDDARHDEARRRDHPRHDRCSAPPTCRPRGARRRASRRRARRRTRPSSTTCRATYTRIAVGEPLDGWLSYADSGARRESFAPDGADSADDPLLLYFTSGTTAQAQAGRAHPRVLPVGHLSTMYWIGLQPGDVHLNISSPGWAKHAWSNVFAPWNAEATDARRQLRPLRRAGAARPDGRGAA